MATIAVPLLLFCRGRHCSWLGWLVHVRRFADLFSLLPCFYVLHISLIHSVALAASYACHEHRRFWIGPGDTWSETVPAGWGYSLPVIYATWIAGITLLYLRYRWFSQLKARRRDWWLITFGRRLRPAVSMMKPNGSRVRAG